MLAAIVAVLAPERVSRLMSGSQGARHRQQNLEWVLEHADVRMQATLVHRSARWPARLRQRIAAHQLASGLDVDAWLRRLELARARDDQPIIIA